MSEEITLAPEPLSVSGASPAYRFYGDGILAT
jgi:phage-related baseplate assembly protein